MPVTGQLLPGVKDPVIPIYDVANSLRFNDASDDSLTKTFGSAVATRQQATVSMWVKLGNIDHTRFLFECSDGANPTQLYISSGNKFAFYDTATNSNFETNAVLRDVSAWYHLVCQVDTTQASNSNRVKLYINGVLQSTSTSNTLTQNNNILWGKNSTHTIGKRFGSSDSFDGYIAEFVFIMSSSLDATSFGEFDTDSPNIWKPIDVSGLTFNSNSFYLDFEDSSALGNDVSGLNNDFTVNNLTATDQSIDTCTNNFATWNPLTNGSYQTLSEGNLKGTGNTSTNNGNTWSTIHFPSAGKWYWETKVITHSSSASYPQVGIIRDNTIAQGDMNGGSGGYVSSSTDCYYPAGSTTVYSKDGNDTVSATSVNDILMCAMDSTAGAMKFWIGVNGTWFASGDPANGNNAQWAETGDYQPVAFQSNFNNSVSETNFGAPTFSISSGNADANGHGNFEYAPPTGFFALCTKNLAEFG
tara:strand:- start:321 stop:1736 length:1416 start_codon:yes stop_codon:yes gene_type:complete